MPYVVDVKLGSGVTARVHSRPSHKMMQQMTRDARRRAKEESVEAILVDNLLTMCEGWDARDEDDSPIPWTREGLESAPNDILIELSEECQKFVQRGATIDARLKDIAGDMDEDDPRLPKLLDLIDPGN